MDKVDSYNFDNEDDPRASVEKLKVLYDDGERAEIYTVSVGLQMIESLNFGQLEDLSRVLNQFIEEEKAERRKQCAPSPLKELPLHKN